MLPCQYRQPRLIAAPAAAISANHFRRKIAAVRAINTQIVSVAICAAGHRQHSPLVIIAISEDDNESHFRRRNRTTGMARYFIVFVLGQSRFLLLMMPARTSLFSSAFRSIGFNNFKLFSPAAPGINSYVVAVLPQTTNSGIYHHE